ncbi:MAG TPA: hypothetical protein PK986_01460 [Spirochaetota bacterium]|nr:hypothetical protein [Spirochaetota bacterium]
MVPVLLALTSVTLVIAKGDIFIPLKNRIVRHVPAPHDETVSLFLYCPMCLGVWVGIIGSFMCVMDWLPFMVWTKPIIMGCMVGTCAGVIDHLVFQKSENPL